MKKEINVSENINKNKNIVKHIRNLFLNNIVSSHQYKDEILNNMLKINKTPFDNGVYQGDKLSFARNGYNKNIGFLYNEQNVLIVISKLNKEISSVNDIEETIYLNSFNSVDDIVNTIVSTTNKFMGNSNKHCLFN